MPSPVGHALAGVAAAWGADLVPGRRAWRTGPPAASWYQRAGDGLTIGCAVLAAIPDADLLLGFHRGYSHSLGAVTIVGLLAAQLAARAHLPIARVACMCAAAYGTHLLLDWLGVDTWPPYGIQAFWPFTDRWYISGWDLFGMTQRDHLLTMEAIRTNTLALVQEVAILLPVLAVLWSIRVKALARLAPEMARGDHAPQ